MKQRNVMKKLTMNLLAATLLAAVVAGGAGCSTTVQGTSPGASAVVWDSGTLKSQEYATFDVGCNAAVMALNQLGHAVVGQERNEVLCTLTARAVGDKKITVRVRKVSGTVVGFEIRVGTWGEQVQSLEILQAIRKRL
ncbi:MAG TPA: DUF3568 family protein [Verrucomicrobiota bacterium]|nr:DUF3568 family protein [Verrucomicrobiota bacterium]